MTETVSEKDLTACLIKFRNLRLWAVLNNIDAWAFRQMLIIALEMDTKASLERGISITQLQNFDNIAKMDIQTLKLRSPHG